MGFLDQPVQAAGLVPLGSVDHMPALRDPDLISRTVLAQVQGGSVAEDRRAGQS